MLSLQCSRPERSYLRYYFCFVFCCCSKGNNIQRKRKIKEREREQKKKERRFGLQIVGSCRQSIENIYYLCVLVDHLNDSTAVLLSLTAGDEVT